MLAREQFCKFHSSASQAATGDATTLFPSFFLSLFASYSPSPLFVRLKKKKRKRKRKREKEKQKVPCCMQDIHESILSTYIHTYIHTYILRTLSPGPLFSEAAEFPSLQVQINAINSNPQYRVRTSTCNDIGTCTARINSVA